MQFSLWPLAESIAEEAFNSGDLQSLNTSSEQVDEQGLQFTLRILSNLEAKQKTASDQKSTDPFLPHEPAMFVSTVGPKHKLLLNKFNVLPNHLLLVTNDFEEQTAPLNFEDFRALYLCMEQADALAFYNSGKEAGASQRHKHLQLIHLKEQPKDFLPLAPLLESLQDDVPRQLEQLPFRHAALALPSELFNPDQTPAEDAALQLQHLYDRLRMTLGIEVEENSVAKPYNLLLTRQWMLLVPREAEQSAGISLNALAFAGSLLVKNAEQAEALKQQGLASSLRLVTG